MVSVLLFFLSTRGIDVGGDALDDIAERSSWISHMGRLKKVQRALITHIESNIGRKSGALSSLDLASIAKGSAPAELDELGAATLAIAATSANNGVILEAMNGLPPDIVAVLVERIKLITDTFDAPVSPIEKRTQSPIFAASSDAALEHCKARIKQLEDELDNTRHDAVFHIFMITL